MTFAKLNLVDEICYCFFAKLNLVEFFFAKLNLVDENFAKLNIIVT